MWRRLVNVLTWFVVAGSVAIILGGLTGRPVLLAAVPTGSMQPVLNPGDLIPLLPTWGTELRTGQIIVFRTDKDETWIVHRIVGGSAEEGFITRGDANAEPDPYLVYPRHVAGTVPQVGHSAIKVPRLGALSLERSAMSSPLVAGIAMVLGVYLLVSDVRVTWRNLRSFRSKRLHMPVMRGDAVLAVYLGLGAAVLVGTAICTWSMGSRELGRYTVVKTLGTNVQVSDILVEGDQKSDTAVFENKSPFPLVVGMEADDPNIKIAPQWAVVTPGGKRELNFTIHANGVGEHHPAIRRAVYLPLLPLPFIMVLARINWYLPVFATALVPALLVLVFAAFDSRVLMHLHTVRRKLILRLRI